ncbi:MAG TPA: metallophosphoesterase, partial [Methanocorpusculum sp.]|nr:metallophosphoesterase [Methanocorpusculum sp.]
MEPEFYPTGPAVAIERREKVLAIADPHFGVEADLHRKGLHFESRSALRLERLMEIIEESDPDYLVVLGDLKHMIPYVTRQEKAEMPQILKTIRRETEFRLAPGNHDTGLEHYLMQDELLPASGAVIDGTGYFHGHMIPDESLFGHLIVCGHHHPVVNLYDDVGCALRGTPGYLLAEV